MQNTRVLIFRLWKVLSKRRQKQLIILMIFNILTAIGELLVIGTVIPFLTVLSNPESISKNYLHRDSYSFTIFKYFLISIFCGLSEGLILNFL